MSIITPSYKTNITALIIGSAISLTTLSACDNQTKQANTEHTQTTEAQTAQASSKEEAKQLTSENSNNTSPDKIVKSTEGTDSSTDISNNDPIIDNPENDPELTDIEKEALALADDVDDNE